MHEVQAREWALLRSVSEERRKRKIQKLVAAGPVVSVVNSERSAELSKWLWAGLRPKAKPAAGELSKAAVVRPWSGVGAQRRARQRQAVHGLSTDAGSHGTVHRSLLQGLGRSE